MDTPITCIEISHSSIKLLIGYLYQKKVYVLYASESTRCHLQEQHVKDINEMTNSIKELVSTASKDLNYPISDVIVGLNPYKLNVVSSSAETTTSDATGKVSNFDGCNLINMLKKQFKSHQDVYQIGDILPLKFTLDEKEESLYFPLGRISNNIKIEADTILVDKFYYSEIQKSIENAGLKILQMVVIPNSTCKYISEVLEAKKIANPSFVYIDYQNEDTILSYYQNRRLVTSTCLGIGYNQLSNDLAKAFNISIKQAEYYRDIYGLGKIPSFDFTISNTYSLKDIQDVILNSLEKINSGIWSFVSSIDKSGRDNFVVSGEGSKLINLRSYLMDQFKNNIGFINPVNYGARDPSYINLIAMLKYYEDYPIKINQNRPNDLTLTSAINFKTKTLDEISNIDLSSEEM